MRENVFYRNGRRFFTDRDLKIVLMGTREALPGATQRYTERDIQLAKTLRTSIASIQGIRRRIIYARELCQLDARKYIERIPSNERFWSYYRRSDSTLRAMLLEIKKVRKATKKGETDA
jgi:hypothetical protein